MLKLAKLAPSLMEKLAQYEQIVEQCPCVFTGCVTTQHLFRISLTVSYGSLTENAPFGKEGAAFGILMGIKALLPEGWEKDFTTFFDLSGEVLISLIACSVDGVQTRDMGHTSRSTLDMVEAAIGFHLRDWRLPTKDNYFGSLKHPQIIASLKGGALTGAAPGKMPLWMNNAVP